MTGTGTLLDPYIVGDVTDLQNIDNDRDAYYELGADIDASATAGWNGGKGFRPIGFIDYTWVNPWIPFSGQLDGKGYSITDLTVNRPSDLDVSPIGGLFSFVNGATLKNLELIDPVITVYDYAGSIAGLDGGGCTYDNVTITNPTVVCVNAYAGGMLGYEETNSWFSPIITAVSDINDCHVVGGSVTMGVSIPTLGGMLGWWSEGEIANSSSSAEVSVTGNVGAFMGGFAGWIGSYWGPTYVHDCYSTGDVIGLSDTCGLYGGFAGWLEYIQVEGCYSTGELVLPNANLIGGFTSYVYECDVDDCYATGDIYGVSDLGGFCYCTDSFSAIQSTIDNCYATGDIYVTEDAWGGADIGGFIGRNFAGAIKECFSLGNIYIDNTAAVDISDVGGFVGFNWSWDVPVLIQDCYSRGSIIFTAGPEMGWYVGGFCGWQENLGVLSADIVNCYSTGVVPVATGILTDLGGFVAYNLFGNTTDCFWDTQTSGWITSDGGTGKTTAEMKVVTTFPTWDFSTVWLIVPTCNDGYPCLINATPSCAVVVRVRTLPVVTLAALRSDTISLVRRPRFS